MIDHAKLNITGEDSRTIANIVARAHQVGRQLGVYIETTSTVMDLEVVHDSIGLKLDELLESDDFNLMHDISGIARHLNRDTGKLEHCFSPRFSRR